MLERLLDSVILIDHFNGHPKASGFLAGLNPEATAISVITIAEILVGFEKESEKVAKLLLNQFKVLSIEVPVAEKAASLRRQYGWKLPDAFQAALAMHYHVLLSTRNIKDFDPRKHPFVEIPYKL